MPFEGAEARTSKLGDQLLAAIPDDPEAAIRGALEDTGEALERGGRSLEDASEEPLPGTTAPVDPVAPAPVTPTDPAAPPQTPAPAEGVQN